MSYYRNLIPGQWQIGEIVMGLGTNIKVEDFDAKPYDVNAQDYQVSRADEVRFGFDQFKPSTITLTLDVLHNRMLPGYEDTKPNFWHDMPNVFDLAREWRFDEGRQIWGQMKPLYVNSKLDQTEKIIFGRPGQFGSTADDDYNGGEIVKCLCEFRRADTLAYSLYENVVEMNQDVLTQTIAGLATRQGPAWMRVLIYGPVHHPVITFNNLFNSATPVIIDFDYNVAVNEVVEISAYPWARRVVNNGTPVLNLAANLVGSTPYLDRLRFNFDAEVDISMTTSGSMNADTLVAVLWRDVYTVI